ncbi:MAG: efflux RND transporter periplasmic adaptor subunit [Lentimicrobium sp.]|jgi:HlyD family secretion protein|nr:efflux RND transporter periplasmic adaptor subunit [Lentimicrobium sp.]
MKTIIYSLMLIFMVVFIESCNNKDASDAFGNFEAVETTISAEANGRILMLHIEEGSELEQGDTVGLIDTTDLHLKRAQLLAQHSAVASKRENLYAQVAVYNQQKENLAKDRQRIANMLKEQAATPKQLDDVDGAIAVAGRQIGAVQTQQVSLNEELRVIDVQIAQVNESISRCYITNPVKGTVLSRYAESGEVTAFGKPLYKIADLSTMELRVYISGDMLSTIKTGQQAKVLIDGKDTIREFTGEVTWISPTAEFTPKTIQTRDERVNLVYAVKLIVQNDGSLKIAMPAEVVFTK